MASDYLNELDRLDHNIEDLMDDDELGLSAEVDAYERRLDEAENEQIIWPRVSG